MQVETDTGQTVYMQVEPETGQTAYIQVEPDTGQTAYTTSSMVAHREDSVRPAGPAVDSARPTGPAVARRQEGDSARPAGHTVAQQQEGEMAVERKPAAPLLGDTVDRFLPEPRMHNFRHKPETEIAEQRQRLSTPQERDLETLQRPGYTQ